MFWLIARKQSEEDWVRHTLAVRNQLANVLILVQRTETGQRGYLLTDRDVYLEPYNAASLENSPRRSTRPRSWLVIIHGNGRLWKNCGRSLPGS
ncbi:MAG: CHASE3 domain-containing protein [Xanthobacteraceae bacterium]